MKFDTIIIGGGLCGLVAGIDLVRKGQKCLIVSSGQSALHFFSGSLELYGKDECPLEAVGNLGKEHPYAKLGADRVEELSHKVKPFFADLGINFKGDASKNHWRLTPLGVFKRAWLTLDEFASFPEQKFPWKRVAVLNMDGFLDFHTSYIAAALEKQGVECKVAGISMPQLDRLRENPTEMRSTNISKALTGDVINTLAARINEKIDGVDAVLMPAVVGLTGSSDVIRLKELVDRPICFLPTLPPSVPGIRMQLMLKRHFQKLGGVYMLGDSVVSGNFCDGRLKSIKTVNHQDTEFEADNFILATGSFFSKGLVADQNGVTEPVFGLDTDASSDRGEWYRRNMFDAQPYMDFGVAADGDLRAMKDGVPVPNLYAAGAVLSGFNPIKEGSGAGVSVLTALHIADRLTSKPVSQNPQPVILNEVKDL